MDYKVIIVRLVAAVLVGGLIGYERERENSPAGFRTNILVCVGATVVALISESNLQRAIGLASNPMYQNIIKVDIGRLGAQVISGIGFLGAGTILVEKGTIKGLTTAATLWLVACLGLALGQGLYAISFTGAVIVVITLSFFKKADNFINERNSRSKKKKKDDVSDLDYFENNNI